MKTRLLKLVGPIVIVVLLAASFNRAYAQEGSTLIAEGLNGPMGVLVAPDGAVWVVDSGTGGDDVREGIDPATRQPSTIRGGESSRILKILPDGTNEVVAWLPSVMTNPNLAFGGARLAMLERELYVTSGAWSEVFTWDREILHAAVVRIVDGERTEIANTWDVERDRNPDGLMRDSNPYGLTLGPDGMLWVADAAANTVLKVDPATGRLEVVAVFEGIDSPIPSPNRGGSLETDPVPTAVAFDDEGRAYVSLLSGFPFRTGAAQVARVAADGTVEHWATNLTMLTDLRRGPDGELYAVSYQKVTEQGPLPNSGAIVRVRAGSNSEEVITGLSNPTSVDFNPAGDAFVTINGGGPSGAGELWKFESVAIPRASEPEPLRYTRVHADSTGASHFADAELVLTSAAVPGASRPAGIRPLDGAGEGTFFCFEPGTTVDWHSAPHRQFYLILSGGIDLEVSDGEVRRFGPGDILLGEATKGKGVRADWSDAGRSCGIILPLSASAERLTGVRSPPISRTREQHGGPKQPIRNSQAGTLQPLGPPSTRVVQPSGEGACVVDLTQDYRLTGPLTGSAQIDYRILVQGTCEDPPGTYGEEWIAVGTFDGTIDGSDAFGTFHYVARVQVGGGVEGRIALGGGLSGELLISGNFSEGVLRYEFAGR